MVAKVLPDSLGTQRLLIRSLVARTATCAFVGTGRVEIISQRILVMRPPAEPQLLSISSKPAPFPSGHRYGLVNFCKYRRRLTARCFRSLEVTR